jgi:AcrR family transcriptional regulator
MSWFCPCRYTVPVPKLWTETVTEHRRAVRQAILDTTAALVTEHGLASVTMSRIAEQAGIGRATLYKYFPDVDAILIAWHHQHVAGHLEQLTQLRDGPGDARTRLVAMLQTYALIAHQRGRQGGDLSALVHRGEHVADAQRQLIDLIADLLTEVAASGELRTDVPPEELATYCLHALSAASGMPSRAAVQRLVIVILAGLQPAH